MTIDPRSESVQYFVVSGGHKGKPDPNKSGAVQCFSPAYHGSNIDPTDMPFNTPSTPPFGPFCEMQGGPPEPGTVLTGTRSALGEGSTLNITGAISGGINGTGQTVAGNKSLGQDIISRVQGFKTEKSGKPRVIEKMVDGVLVRKIEETGKDWMHNMTQGIAPHAAWNPIAGQFLQEMKNVETAIQSFAQIPNAGMIAKLPGSIMNLGSLVKGLTSKQKAKVTQNMSPLVAQGFESMTNLMSDTETSGTTMTGGRINPEVFTENMIDLLSQVTNISDLVDVMQRLHNDESIRGLEEYAKSAETGLLAETALRIAIVPEEEEEEEEVSYLILNKTVGESIVYFTEGYSINVGSQTHIVISAEQDSMEITVFPKIEKTFVDERVKVYLPVSEIEVDGPYGPMTMDIDMNGNMKPNKSSAESLQKAMKGLQTAMSLCPGGSLGKSLFGDAGAVMGQLFNRIPNNGAQQILGKVASLTAITGLTHSINTKGLFPFKTRI